MRKSLLALSALAASTPALAADYSDDIYKNDNAWLQFNIMHTVNEKPSNKDHTYLEMEFGGRSGIFDLYGYVDVFNLTSDDNSDKYGDDQIFVKFAPRMSLDGLTGKDLSFGPVQELYIANYTTIDGGADYKLFDENGEEANKTPGFVTKWGFGSDVMVPWFGKMQFNLYKTYDVKAKDWNGYQVSTNWFKPFTFFDNGSFLAYQGYIDYEFGRDEADVAGEQFATKSGGSMFNGLYWHSNKFAVGYGLKLYKDVYGLKDGHPFLGDTSGVAHYFAATYKF